VNISDIRPWIFIVNQNSSKIQ